jgi:hypothetical protein
MLDKFMNKDENQVKVKLSLYRPGQAQRSPEGSGSKNF